MTPIAVSKVPTILASVTRPCSIGANDSRSASFGKDHGFRRPRDDETPVGMDVAGASKAQVLARKLLAGTLFGLDQLGNGLEL